jgi:hypothetical protein
VCSITGVSTVMVGRDCYEIVFDDGERVTCDGEHQWPVWDFTNDVPVPKVLKTEEMKSRVRIGNSKRNRYAIGCCRPVEMPEQDLIINPEHLSHLSHPSQVDQGTASTHDGAAVQDQRLSRQFMDLGQEFI